MTTLPTPPRFARLLGFTLLVLLALLLYVSAGRAHAHPMPSSRVLLDLHGRGVNAELQLPLSELQTAFGDKNITRNPATLVARLGPEMRAYLTRHVRPRSADGRAWAVAVGALQVQTAEQAATGPYQELTAHLALTPPPGADPRTFTLYYDVIIHQLVTHTALVAVRQDWAAGRLADAAPAEVGVVRLDVRRNLVPPLRIVPTGGSAWRGFRAMVGLGVRHIAEGTDHLLFLLALLLPAPLRAAGRCWGRAGGPRYGLSRLLRLVTAFTLGHSLTLLAGALGWVHLPPALVESLIAASILVSAGHAVRPLFAGWEGAVAAGFGLVHGLAFAGTLTSLHLTAGPLALSILGFNLGIELRQLLVIGLVVPWLLLLSRTPAHAIVRVAGAGLAGLAALGWLAERALGLANPLPALAEAAAGRAPWLLAALAGLAVLSRWRWPHGLDHAPARPGIPAEELSARPAGQSVNPRGAHAGMVARGA